ncbi:MAG: tetratricopeptide repeat protein [Pseudomonadota bacterium]
MFKSLIFASLIFASSPDFGPSEEMFDELKSAETQNDASSVASDIWDAWMESGSAAADLVMSRAVDAQANGDRVLARSLYDRVIAIQPDYAEAWNRRATLFLEDENYTEALRDVNEALRLEPRHFGAWAGLGAVLESLGAEDEAIEAYHEALKIYPLFPAARRALTRLQQDTEGRPV